MLQLPSFLVLVTFFFLIMVVMKQSWKKRRGCVPKLPPGPPKLPFIGNLHQLARSSSLPHIALRDLAKKYGPIMHLKLGEGSAIVVSSAKAAQEVLKKHELCFEQRPNFFANDVAGYGNFGLFFAPNGKFCKHIRKICTVELFGAKQVRSFMSQRREEVQNLVESVASSSSSRMPIDLSEMIFQTTISIVSRAAFGKKCKDAKDFMAVLKEGNELASGFDLPDLFPSLMFLPFVSRMKPTLEDLKRRMDNVLDNIINEHRAKGNKDYDDDVVDVLLRLQQESNDLEFPITSTNIKAIIMDIFAAGTETTATTIEWAMSEILRNPKVMETTQVEIRQVLRGKTNINEEDIHEMKYLKLVIKETFRLHPPGALLPRESRETCEINGYEIPKKTKAIVNLWAIGRDPKHWHDPDCFRPERFHGSSINYTGTSFELLPFGAGRRMCPGLSFGIATIELQLAKLLYHFDWKLSDGIKPEQLDMTEAFGFTVKRKHSLHVIATHPNFVPSFT